MEYCTLPDAALHFQPQHNIDYFTGVHIIYIAQFSLSVPKQNALNKWMNLLFWMHRVIVFFSFSLGKWNNLFRLIESGVPWGITFTITPSSGTVSSLHSDGVVAPLNWNTHAEWKSNSWVLHSTVSAFGSMLVEVYRAVHVLYLLFDCDSMQCCKWNSILYASYHIVQNVNMAWLVDATSIQHEAQIKSIKPITSFSCFLQNKFKYVIRSQMMSQW